MTQKLVLEKNNHEKWLLKNNCHPTQIAKRKKKNNPLKGFNVANDYYGNQSNTISPSGAVKSIWEDVRLGNETPATIAAIKEKASRVGPAFNKGGMQLLPKDQIIYSGKK